MARTLELITTHLRMGTGESLTTFTNKHYSDEDALPIRDLTIRWSRPSPRDHMDPTEIEFTLRIPKRSPDRATALAYDARIVVEAEITGAGHTPTTVLLFDGNLTSWQRGPSHQDHHDFVITGTDLIGRLAASNIGDTPWPSGQYVRDRLNRISEINPSGPFTWTVQNYSEVTRLGPRDVDNMPTLDAVRLCGPPGTIVDANPHLRISAPSRYLVRSIPPVNNVDHRQPWRVPASLIEDTGRALDRTHTLTEVGVTGWFTTGQQEIESRTYRSATTWAPARATWESDVRPLAGGVQSWALDIINHSWPPRPALPGMPRLLIDGTDAIESPAAMLDMAERKDLALYIAGAPADFDRIHYVTAQTITISGHDLDLAMELQPASLFGTIRPTFHDVRTTTWAPPTGGPDRPRFGDFRTTHHRLRFRDVAITRTRPPNTL